MNLRYTLPASEQYAFDALDEEIIYCIPYDLSDIGLLVSDCYAIATSKSIVLIREGRIFKKILLSECEKVKCEALVYNGALVATIKGEESILFQFSMTYLTQFSYFARGVNLIINGDDIVLDSKEPERICPKCHRALPGTRDCIHCGVKGRFLRRLWTMIKPTWKSFMVMTIFIFVSAILMLGARYVERRFIDSVLIPRKGGLNDVIIFFFTVLVMNLGALVLGIIKNKMSVKLGSLISKNLREQLYKKIQDLSLQFISNRSPGELMNRIQYDTSVIRRFMEIGFANMFSTMIFMFGALVIMSIMSWQLTLIAVSTMPIIIIVSLVSRKAFHAKFTAQWKLADRANNQIQDVLSGIRVVKAFGKEKTEVERFKEINLKLAKTQSKNEKFWSTFSPAISFLLGISSLFVLYFGGRYVLNGTFTIGELGQFMGYAGMLLGPLSWITMLPRLLVETISSIERIYDVLDEEKEIKEKTDPVKVDIKGNVVFDNVYFGYKSYEPVLEEITFNIKEGEMIGIVGPSGAGKSTLINLLIRLYDADAGNIYIDGVNIKDLDMKNYHSRIGVVLQETFLFSGSILENIRYAVPDSTYDEVINAAKVANAHDFIIKFPDGYNSKVGEKGLNLSGGERQRIAIARAILINPSILILDEATSSLDTETEFQIQEAIYRLTAGRTTFAIAHRLSTLRKSDRIIVIDQHKIAEIGTHNELLKQKGLYYDLVTAQLKMNKVETPKEFASVASA
ncbi:MAG: ABC transporter ATP-binding protein [Saccharofermentanales bacterium]